MTRLELLSALLIIVQIQTGLCQDMRYVQLATALNLGDNCSWTAESLRLGLTRAVLYNPAITLKWTNQISKNNEPICNGNRLTVCSRETRKCVCGEPYSLLMRSIRPTPELHVIEDGICRRDEGSGCVAEESLIKLQNRLEIDMKIDSKCKQGTKCLTNSNKQYCSAEAMAKEFAKSGTSITNQAASIDAIYRGKICTCQSSPPEPENFISATEFESLENDLDEPRGRSKREITKKLMGLAH